MNITKTNSEIYQDLERSLFGNMKSSREVQISKELSQKVFDHCTQFLMDQRIISPSKINPQDSMHKAVASMESVNADVSMERIGASSIMDLVHRCNVPANKEQEAAEAVINLLAKFKACAGNDSMYRVLHFSRSKDAENSVTLQGNMQATFAPSLYGMMGSVGIPSNEAFGADIDKVLPDIRASLAVTLLQFHKGILDRLIHRRTSSTPYVKYVVPYVEVYDMLKSNDASSKVRNSDEHNIPFIELYADPRQVSNKLQPIIPLLSNDTEGVVYADGYVKYNCRANLFDLSVIANQLGKSHYNFTDLVSENVILNEVLMELKSGDKTEIIRIDTSHLSGARLQMRPNTKDSGIRSCMLNITVKLDNRIKTIAGEPSAILAKTTSADYVKAVISTAVEINLKYADVEGMGYVRAIAANQVEGAEPSQDVQTLVEGMTVTLLAYNLDACYSEENLRKSNLALRSQVRTFDYEISLGRNILIDYAFDQELPEFLMSQVTEATNLGQDHRGLDVIVKELLFVYDRVNEESEDPTLRSRLDKIGFEYVASQKVRPVVELNTIDLDNVDTIRSSDVLGDIRQYVEWELINLTSLYFQNSFYRQQLNAGEKPCFKVLTSSVILDNIMNIPHIHNHLNTDQATDGANVEYRRVLPNGVVLDCVSTSYNYMRDKIVMIPYRENMPEDVLNWGANWDYGTFVAHYNPQIDNGVNKRIFSNSRAMVIPQNPGGIYLDVRNISKIVDLFAVVNPTSSRLPQPSDIVAEAKQGE